MNILDQTLGIPSLTANITNSSGTCGPSPKSLGKHTFLIHVLAFITNNTFNRISARPTFTAQSFHVGVVGQHFDPKHLLSVQKFIEFFHEQTGRKDLVFNEIRMLTYWK